MNIKSLRKLFLINVILIIIGCTPYHKSLQAEQKAQASQSMTHANMSNEPNELVFNTDILSSAETNAGDAQKIRFKTMIQLNAENINKIKVGMAREDVVGIMGNYYAPTKQGNMNNPWKIDSINNTEIYHYFFRGKPPFAPWGESQATQVFFENGKVVAVGRGYLKQYRANAIAPVSEFKEDSLEIRLQKLKGLFDSGAIDEATYNAQIKRILDSI